MEVIIRKAQMGDLAKIQELNLLLFKKEIQEYDDKLDDNWTFSEIGTNYFSDKISGETNCTFVAEKDGRIIGYLTGGFTKVYAYRKVQKMIELDNMFVLEEYRSQGIGAELVKKFKNWCKENGAEKISVTASFGNRKGVEFYKKQGFHEYDLILEMDV